MAKKSSAPEMRCFLACDFVQTEDESRKSSIIGMFDSMRLGRFPGAFKSFFLFAKLRQVSPGSHTVHISGRLPGGKQVFGDPLEFPIVVEPDKHGLDLVVQIGVLEFAEPGILRFTLKVDGVEVGWPCELTAVLWPPPKVSASARASRKKKK